MTPTFATTTAWIRNVGVCILKEWTVTKIREILFRGKRIDDGKWVEGFYLYTNENTQPVIIDMECCSNVIIPETIGQYTGLVDKNGVKIFEGDIIWLNRRYYKVIYDTLFYAGFCARDLDGDIVSLSRICVEYDVVGNIYDNPNMIGGDQNCLIVKEYTLQ